MKFWPSEVKINVIKLLFNNWKTKRNQNWSSRQGVFADPQAEMTNDKNCSMKAQAMQEASSLNWGRHSLLSNNEQVAHKWPKSYVKYYKVLFPSNKKEACNRGEII